ncbi:ABC transporter permease [bacterium]|nr:ABC transporter permease [bacterium]
MLLFLRLAWRNIFRNTRRTVLSGLAIGIGLAALILTDALIIGMEEHMIRMTTDTLLGQGQIHATDFRQTFAVEKTIPDGQKILDQLAAEHIIRSYTPRTTCYAMISSPANVDSIMLYGIDPEREPTVSKLGEMIIDGSFLAEGPENRVMIGSKLAESLEVTVGDRIVLTVAQAQTGELSQEMYRIGAIFQYDIRDLDRGLAFIHLEKAQKMLGLGQEIHEIAFHFTDIHMSRDRSLPFWKNYSKPGTIAESWMDILSELEALLKLSQYSVLIAAFILFGVVSLGIMNTLFMSLYERMFEFGVLRAVGTRPCKLALIIIGEAGAISVISIVIGIIIGFLVTLLLIWVGIDYRGLEFGGVAFREKLYPVLTVWQFIIYPFWLFVFTCLIGIYPAIYAARITPATAMRKSF